MPTPGIGSRYYNPLDAGSSFQPTAELGAAPSLQSNAQLNGMPLRRLASEPVHFTSDSQPTSHGFTNRSVHQIEGESGPPLCCFPVFPFYCFLLIVTCVRLMCSATQRGKGWYAGCSMTFTLAVIFYSPPYDVPVRSYTARAFSFLIQPMPRFCHSPLCQTPLL
jgi:hypothetical protein